MGPHNVFVRDRNGCGIVQKSVAQDLTLEGFPRFFTPNGDGMNDLWQFIPPPSSGIMILGKIEIFDRFGTLLARIDPASLGWDGNYKGKPLPASDYWFLARDESNQQLMGHFALKR
jgi:gliding motility-associated-like protein